MLYDLWDRYRLWFIITGVSLFVVLSFLFYPGATEYGPAPPFQTAVFASESTPALSSSSADLSDKTSVSSSTSAFLSSSTPSSSSVDPASDLATKDQAIKPQYVDLKGAVKNPGVYSFLPNERIHDVLQKAGGLLPTADQNRINLAQPLEDGMMIWIPAKNEITPNFPSSAPANHTTPAVPVTSRAGSQASSKNGLVNLNTASVEQLMTLSGIGETRAKAIMRYREEKGSFRTIQQLQEIPGIGEKLMEKIKDQVTLQ